MPSEETGEAQAAGTTQKTSGKAFVLPSKASKAIVIKKPPEPVPTYQSTASEARWTGNASASNNTTQPSNASRNTTQVGPRRAENDLNVTSLDINASLYIPQWLKAINESYSRAVYCKPLSKIDYAHYISRYAGSDLLVPLKDRALIQDHVFEDPEELSTTTYTAHFSFALRYEYGAQSAHLQTLRLYNVPLQVHDASQDLHFLTVPGLREHSPRIDLGDTVRVRPLIKDPNAIQNTIAWHRFGPGHNQIAPAFTGYEYHAQVWGVSRAKEQVLLRIDGCFAAHGGALAVAVNVIFLLQQHQQTSLYRAIESATRSLAAKLASTWTKRMLFPDASYGFVQKTLPKGRFDLQWHDDLLNYEQQKAVANICAAKYGDMPYLISGPPGTGKTKTIVETALQLLKKRSDVVPHLLICAPSDPAADTLALRLSKHLPTSDLFRLNSWSRSFAEVPGSLLPFSYSEDDLFTLPEWRRLMSYKVIVTTCRAADILVQTRCTNEAIMLLANEMLGALLPNINQLQELKVHFTALLLDEAAQATEPEALIPLQVVDPGKSWNASNSYPQVIMAGDQYQLGPRLQERSNEGLAKSLFQRLFELPVYADHPLARNRNSRAKLPYNYPPFTNLIRNYRSNPAILAVPSQLFYNDTLIPECLDPHTAITEWQKLFSMKPWPVRFIVNNSPDIADSVLTNSTGAIFNHAEAHIALTVVQELLALSSASPHPDPILQHEIMLMSPYPSQVSLLRRSFRSANRHAVNIGPLEAFQGLESKVVILCTTRTRAGTLNAPTKYIDEDKRRGLGVIDEPKRFNVAVTRAKVGLVVIGCPEALLASGDRCWETLIAFCARNGCLQREVGSKDGGVVDKLMQQDWPRGRLERGLLLSEKLKSEGSGQGKGKLRQTMIRRKGGLRGAMAEMDEQMWQQGVEMEAVAAAVDAELDNDTLHENSLHEDLRDADDDDDDDEDEDDVDGSANYNNNNNSTSGAPTQLDLDDLDALEDGEDNENGETLSSSPAATSESQSGEEDTDTDTNLNFEGFDRDLKREFEAQECPQQ